MAEKIGSPTVTYIETGLRKDDISYVGQVYVPVVVDGTSADDVGVTPANLRTSELGTRYTPIGGGNYFYNYDPNTGAVTLAYGRKFTNNMLVVYTAPFVPPTTTVNIDKYKSNVDSRRKSNISTQDAQTIKDQQFNRLNNESVTINKDLGEVGGVISLAPFAQEGITVTNRLMPSKLSSTFGDGLLNDITESSAIQSMLGKAKTGLVKRKVITHPSPVFLESKLKTIFPKMTGAKRRLLSTDKFAVNAKKAQTTLIPENLPKIQSIKKVTEIVKSKLPFINFSGLGMTIDKVTNKAGIFSGVSRSKQNVMAHKEANSFFNVLKNVGTKITDKLPVFSDKTKAAISSAFNGQVPDMIDDGGNTNLHKLASKGSLLTSLPSPNINKPLAAAEKFDGYNTPADYEFTFISSPEELAAELNRSSRGPKSNNIDSIRALFLGHSGSLYGPEEKVNAKFIHEENKRLDAQDEGLTEVTSNPLPYGIQSHYIITRAGNIQRGRPTGVIRNFQYTKFSRSGLMLTFIATETTPINKKQEDAFDKFLQGFFIAFPEYPVYANYQWNLEDAAGYNVIKKVRDGLSSKYKISYKYEDISDLEEMPLKPQIAMTKPVIVAAPSSTGKKLLTPGEANELIQSDAFQKQVNDDIDLAMKKIEANNLLLSGVSRDEVEAKLGASSLPDGDPRAKLEADFKTYEAGMDRITKESNKYLKGFNGSFNSVKKLSDNITG